MCMMCDMFAGIFGPRYEPAPDVTENGRPNIYEHRTPEEYASETEWAEAQVKTERDEYHPVIVVYETMSESKEVELCLQRA